MVSIRAYFVAIPVLIVVAACGGSTTDSTNPTGDSGAADGSTSDSAVASDGDNGGEGGPVIDGATIEDAGARIDGNDGGGCPNVFGGYTMLASTGAGCGDLNLKAQQCIQPGSGGGGGGGGGGGNKNGCDIRFHSEQPATVPAVNGPATGNGVDLQPDGTFTNADLKEGTNNRTGCTGAWDGATQTMTVTCGGTSATQSCVVTMVKTSATCP